MVLHHPWVMGNDEYYVCSQVPPLMLKPSFAGINRALRSGLMIVLIASGSPVWAATYEDPYAPPEIAYANELRQTVTVARRVNINKTGLNQLKGLPGLDEELALKVMRVRPFEGVQDFYRKMPDLSKKNMDLLFQQLQPKVLFK